MKLDQFEEEVRTFVKASCGDDLRHPEIHFPGDLTATVTVTDWADNEWTIPLWIHPDFDRLMVRKALPADAVGLYTYLWREARMRLVTA